MSRGEIYVDDDDIQIFQVSSKIIDLTNDDGIVDEECIAVWESIRVGNRGIDNKGLDPPSQTYRFVPQLEHVYHTTTMANNANMDEPEIVEEIIKIDASINFRPFFLPSNHPKLHQKTSQESEQQLKNCPSFIIDCDESEPESNSAGSFFKANERLKTNALYQNGEIENEEVMEIVFDSKIDLKNSQNIEGFGPDSCASQSDGLTPNMYSGDGRGKEPLVKTQDRSPISPANVPSMRPEELIETNHSETNSDMPGENHNEDVESNDSQTDTNMESEDTELNKKENQEIEGPIINLQKNVNSDDDQKRNTQERSIQVNMNTSFQNIENTNMQNTINVCRPEKKNSQFLKITADNQQNSDEICNTPSELTNNCITENKRNQEAKFRSKREQFGNIGSSLGNGSKPIENINLVCTQKVNKNMNGFKINTNIQERPSQVFQINTNAYRQNASNRGHRQGPKRRVRRHPRSEFKVPRPWPYMAPPTLARPVRRRLRPIVIDGNNVARAHGLPRQLYSCKGIELCVDYFKQRGHSEITVFVPHHITSHRPPVPVANVDIIHSLHAAGHIAFTPSRLIDGQLVSSYDDRFVLELAARTGAVVVSNDNFRDIIGEQPAWKHAVRHHLLMFCMVGDNFMPPQDPLGPRGPSLDEFLAFPPAEY